MHCRAAGGHCTASGELGAALSDTAHVVDAQGEEGADEQYEQDEEHEEDHADHLPEGGRAPAVGRYVIDDKSPGALVILTVVGADPDTEGIEGLTASDRKS